MAMPAEEGQRGDKRFAVAAVQLSQTSESHPCVQ